MSPRPIRRFSEMLELLSRGKFTEKLDEHLNKAIETLEAMPDGKGAATITVAITLNYQEGRLDVKPSVKSKLPDEKGFGGTPFWTHEGALSVQHPSQFDMFSGPRPAEDRSRDTA
jgi:hypothetical protein